MLKSKINITMDKDLIDYIKIFAEEQRTTVSNVFTQFILNLKRTEDKNPTKVILDNPDFTESLLQTIGDIKAGRMKWSKYNEVF